MSIRGLLEGYFSLSAPENKVKGEKENIEGTSQLIDELELTMQDSELIELKNKWEAKWENNEEVKALKDKQKINEKYYLGDHWDPSTETVPLADNLIFQATETFLPFVTRQSPEPIVEADNTPEGQDLCMRVKKTLMFQADRQKLVMRLQTAVRFWSLYLLGVAKVGWDMQKNDIKTVVIRPQKLILDPDATVENCVYMGEYIGEYREDAASDLILRFPKQKEFITGEVQNKMGTQMKYIEWWTDKYIFWTYKSTVLGKFKNPHWNYDQQSVSVDEYGKEHQETVPGFNHFENPRKPYIFLTVFNLGKHPFDDTSTIHQNIALQDLVNKRLKQIEKNADNTNNGLIISGQYFTKEQAAQVANALETGDTVWVPTGNANEAITRAEAPPLPQFVYESLQDYRNELLNIFGIRGLTPQGTMNEKTVRGKVISQGQDSNRASLITDMLEQFADELYNWWTQLMVVYYDEAHFAALIGPQKAAEYITLIKSDINRKLTITVKEGSMLPKDELTKANQAIDLFQAGALDPISLYEALDFPNPQEAAQRLIMWKTNPMGLVGQQPTQPQPQPEQTPPPEGQSPVAPAGPELALQNAIQSTSLPQV